MNSDKNFAALMMQFFEALNTENGGGMRRRADYLPCTCSFLLQLAVFW